MSLPESEAELIRACLASEPAAWEALIRRYEPLIRRATCRWGLSDEDAADVFQTVCVRLLENLRHLRRAESLAAWLTATATHEAWRVLRQRHRGEAWDGSDEGERLEAGDPLPGEIVVQLAEEQMVRDAIGRLDGRCRALLELLYYAEPTPSYAEIACRLGMPEGSVGPTRARCLQRLGRILREMGF